ncbi:MAG TPA: NAD(P)H-binding protein [Chryseosolibacter sp.]
MKTALLAGSTGLIGRQLLQLLLNNPRYTVVKALTRTKLDITHPKLVEIKVDYARLEDVKLQLQADDVYCCLGTTMTKAKTKQKFREIDFEYPLALARITKELGAKQFLLVSALGADKRSSVYYNQVKGELEDAVNKIDFDAIHVFRPSLLLGLREEKRAGEDAAKIVYKIFWFLIPDKYKAIEAIKVAQAMEYYAQRDQKGKFTHESREMQNLPAGNLSLPQ